MPLPVPLPLPGALVMALLLAGCGGAPVRAGQIRRCIDDFGYGVDGAHAEELTIALDTCRSEGGTCEDDVISEASALCITEASDIFTSEAWEAWIGYADDDAQVVWELSASGPCAGRPSTCVAVHSLWLAAEDGELLDHQQVAVR